jgi:hypothetical protein
LEDRDGEVAIRQNGQEHAVAAPDLDGQIHVDLDGEQSILTVPPEVSVQYHDDQVATDGGVPAERTEVDMREFSILSLLFSVVLLVGAGLRMSAGGGIALGMLVSGVLLGYIGARSYWSGRS